MNPQSSLKEFGSKYWPLIFCIGAWVALWFRTHFSSWDSIVCFSALAIATSWFAITLKLRAQPADQPNKESDAATARWNKIWQLVRTSLRFIAFSMAIAGGAWGCYHVAVKGAKYLIANRLNLPTLDMNQTIVASALILAVTAVILVLVRAISQFFREE